MKHRTSSTDQNFPMAIDGKKKQKKRIGWTDYYGVPKLINGTPTQILCRDQISAQDQETEHETEDEEEESEEEDGKPTWTSSPFYQEDDQDFLLKHAIKQSLLSEEETEEEEDTEEEAETEEEEEEEIKPIFNSSPFYQEDYEEILLNHALQQSLLTERKTEEGEEKTGNPTWNSSPFYQEYPEDSGLIYAIEQSLLYFRRESTPSCYLPAPVTAPPVVFDLKQKSPILSLEHIPRSFSHGRSLEEGESSTAYISCSICKDERPRVDSDSLLHMKNCEHRFCEECVHVCLGKQIQDLKGDIKMVKCLEPSCEKAYHYETFSPFLPKEVYDRWKRADIESKFIKCPFEDECGEFFRDDKRDDLIRTCTHCWKVFCLNCRVPWHFGKSCEDFQSSRGIKIFGCSLLDFD